MQIKKFQQNQEYSDVLSLQEQEVSRVIDGGEETLFIGQHSPIYTLGTSTQTDDILNTNNIQTIKTGRGGRVTYHGPGQIIAYPILDLRNRGRDIRKYVCLLQNWVISTLAEFNIQAFTDDDVGVWVETPNGICKIAAIGVRVRKWVTFHGIALNVNPDMNAYNGIVPCGIKGKGVTSMEKLGVTASLEEVEKVLINQFAATLADAESCANSPATSSASSAPITCKSS